METKSYLFRVDKKFLKQGYVLLDENKNIVYEAKMTKFTIFTPFKFLFINHLAHTSVEHKVSHTVTLEQSTFGMLDFFSTKSSFKFDGKKIWDFLHEQGIRIDSHLSNKVAGMTYTVSLKGKEIATLTMANPTGKKLFVVSDVCYNISTTEENLDWAFLSAFAFARTDQVFYN